jgi:hypothetical protein
MTRAIAVSVLLAASISAWASSAVAVAPDVDWVRTYGDSGLNQAYWIETHSNSGYLVSGRWYMVSRGDYDGFLMRVGPGGDTLWTRTYGDSLDDGLFCVRETYDGGNVLAGYTGRASGDVDAWFVRTDSGGDTLWTRQFDFSLVDIFYGVVECPDHGFIACGYTAALGTPDSLNVMALRIDANGGRVWKYIWEDPGDDRAIDLCWTSDGNIAIAGTAGNATDRGDILIMKLDAEAGDTLWTRTYADTARDIASGICEAADGGLLVAGGSMSDVVGLPWREGFLYKTDAGGDTLWTRKYGGYNDCQYVSSVVPTADRGCALGVRRDFNCEGDYDFYFIKVDSDGNTQWDKQIEKGEIQFLLCIAVAPDYGYVSCGYSYTSVPGNNEVWLLKLRPDEAGAPDVEWTTPGVALRIDGSNPFADAVRVAYEISAAGRVDLAVYDVGGRRVTGLVEAALAAGVHRAEWDLKDKDGDRVASGMYFVRLASPGCRAVEKVMVLR